MDVRVTTNICKFYKELRFQFFVRKLVPYVFLKFTLEIENYMIIYSRKKISTGRIFTNCKRFFFLLGFLT